MCGIFGIVSGGKANLTAANTESLLRNLFVLSESRGKESAGIAIRSGGRIHVLKDKVAASDFIRSKAYLLLLKRVFGEPSPRGEGGFSVIAHSRLVTNGSQEYSANNQPCIKDDIVMVHNGIVTNANELWSREIGLSPRRYEVDTEVLAAMIRSRLRSTNNLSGALADTFEAIEGSASVAVSFADLGSLVLATNTGSLYHWFDESAQLLVFASERYILSRIVDLEQLNDLYGSHTVEHLTSGRALHVNTETFDLTPFTFCGREVVETTAAAVAVDDLTPHFAPVVAPAPGVLELAGMEKLLEYNFEEVRALRRCATTLLPETFPFIRFDELGVSNYARHFKKIYADKTCDDLRAILERYRRDDGKPDVVVPFSGGRDSSYGLHLMKTEFGMHPITFTYDWGMVTDLARRNIARVCGELGIENILVSADIKWKRENIRKNVTAWLRNPALGMVPIFMAGDKHFFSVVNQIKEQTGISLNLWFDNRLENTNFKSGFAGIKPKFDKAAIYSISLVDKMRMSLYYLAHFLRTPHYLNGSLWDTARAFKTYYFEPRRDYYLPFDYVRWDERQIEETLIGSYNWETSPDTASTWRIGDGTAAFYNYVYFTVCGFSEYETFRSNQILEGMIDRDEALGLVYAENRPRFESIKWYLDTIGVDFADAIKRVNAIPKLYR